jgi:hypothetical protein
MYLLSWCVLALTGIPAMAQDSAPAKKPAVQHPKATAAPAAGAQSADTWVTKEIPAKGSSSASKKPAGSTAATTNPCRGLDATGCSANKACTWVVPQAAPDSAGTAASPSCQKSKGSAAAKPVAKPAAKEAKANETVTEPAVEKAEKTKPAEVAKPAKEDAPAAAEAATTTPAPEPEQKAAETVEAAPAAPAASETAEAPVEEAPPVQEAVPAPVNEPGKRKAVPAAAGLYVVH